MSSYILVGEAAGTAFGFIVSGLVASAIDWRVAFLVLAISGFFVARELWRTVPAQLRTARWFDVPGAALIFATNPPIQAARLDVVPAGLWGRAQSALTVVRSLA
jgi:predicted MFS family arabinose efflux permease